VAKRSKSKSKRRKPAAVKIPAHDASELAFVAYTQRSGHLTKSVAAEVISHLKSPRARSIGRALLGGPTQDKAVAETVDYLSKLTSSRS
jgi:hypothetical protein